MKTKIKRHSRSVISVILAVCMLISCMTVGLIATDAAKVGSDTVGLGSGDGVNLQIGSGSMSFCSVGSGTYSFTLESTSSITYNLVVGGVTYKRHSSSTVPSGAVDDTTYYWSKKSGQDGANNDFTISGLTAGTYNFKLGSSGGGGLDYSYRFWKTASEEPTTEEPTGEPDDGTTTDTLNRTSGTTMLVTAFTDSNDKYYNNTYTFMKINSVGYVSAPTQMTDANYNGVRYFKPTDKNDTTHNIVVELYTGSTWDNDKWVVGEQVGFKEKTQWAIYRTASNTAGTMEAFDALKIKSIEYPNLILLNSEDPATVTLTADGGFPKFYYDKLGNTADSKEYKLTVTDKSGAEIVSEDTFKYHANSGKYSFEWTPSSLTDNELTFNLSYIYIPNYVSSISEQAFLNSPNVVIYCYTGSAAQTYAQNKSIPYVLLDGVKLGDADGDGSVNVSDVTTIQRYLAELETLEGIYLHAADANQDGTVDISDATALQMYIAEYDLPYPIGEAITQ